jgi:hypothetical protein
MRGTIGERIESDRHLLYEVMNKQKSISSKEIMEDITKIRELLIKPHFNANKELTHRLKHVLERKFSPLFEDSLILDFDQDEPSLLSEWINSDNFETKLLYRASRDGFESTKFHDLCDDKGSTIVLV